MAKIILTQVSCVLRPTKRIVDAECNFVQMGKGTSVTTKNGKECFTVSESIEEVMSLIELAEVKQSDQKLDKILKNQEETLKNQKRILEFLEAIFGENN